MKKLLFLFLCVFVFFNHKTQAQTSASGSFDFEMVNLCDSVNANTIVPIQVLVRRDGRFMGYHRLGQPYTLQGTLIDCGTEQQDVFDYTSLDSLVQILNDSTLNISFGDSIQVYLTNYQFNKFTSELDTIADLLKDTLPVYHSKPESLMERGFGGWLMNFTGPSTQAQAISAPFARYLSVWTDCTEPVRITATFSETVSNLGAGATVQYCPPTGTLTIGFEYTHITAITAQNTATTPCRVIINAQNE